MKTLFTILKSTPTSNNSFCHTLSYVVGPKGFEQNRISLLFTNSAITALTLTITDYTIDDKNCILFNANTTVSAK